MPFCVPVPCCQSCSRYVVKFAMAKLSNTQDFIIAAKNRHGDKFDYSKTVYIKAHQKVTITCKIHGDYLQTPAEHKHGHGCEKCNNSFKYDTTEFVKRAVLIHGDRYDYSKTEYKLNTLPVVIVCSKHGAFEQRPHNHLKGQGCKMCRESLGEKAIRIYLDDKGIEYSREYKFQDCLSTVGGQLRFDYFLPRFNLLIEYHGRQHFILQPHFGDSKSFNDLVARDAIKQQYAADNGYLLLVIKSPCVHSKWNAIQKAVHTALDNTKQIS